MASYSVESSFISLQTYNYIVIAGHTIVLERSRLTTIFMRITTHLKLNLQNMFWSFNDHLQLKVELI